RRDAAAADLSHAAAHQQRSDEAAGPDHQIAAIELRHASTLRVLILVLDDGALMEQYLPARGVALPERGAMRAALALQQRVGQEVDVGAEAAAVKVARLPLVRDRVAGARGEGAQHVLAAVAPARGADFPEIRRDQLLERGGRAVLGAVEDGLEAAQLLERRA